MSTETTREVMQRYWSSDHSDTTFVAEDVVFRGMGTGQEARGREEVSGMLHWCYHLAFDATYKPTLTLFGDKNAVLEAEFVGKQIGEFAGVPATNKEVRVPLCVVYDLENDQITRADLF